MVRKTYFVCADTLEEVRADTDRDGYTILEIEEVDGDQCKGIPIHPDDSV